MTIQWGPDKTERDDPTVQLVVPRLNRARVTETEQCLEVRIPPARSVAGLLMAVVSLVVQGWIIYMLCGIIMAIPRHQGWGELFLVGAFTVMLLAGFEVMYGLFFEISGVERLALAGETLTVSRAIGRFGSIEAHSLSEVSDLRVLQDPPTVRGIQFGRSRNGRLAFTVGTKTRRFGDFLALEEAVKLAQLLHARGMG